MQVASYRTAEGETKVLDWGPGGFSVDGYPMKLDDVLAWDAAGTLSWASPETQAWARALVPHSKVSPEDRQENPGSRLTLLADILVAFAEHPGYTVRYGTDADIVIDNQVALATWPTGKRKVDYAAHMKAVESERVAYYYELLKEQGSGLSFGGFQTESYSTFGTNRSGKTHHTTITGGGPVSYDWDYGATRGIVETVCKRHGWRLKTVLRPAAAKY